MIKVYIKQGKELPLLQGHPWIFSGAVADVKGDVKTGELCEIYTYDKRFVGKGYINTTSTIFCRVLTFLDEDINEDFFRRRLISAIRLRNSFDLGITDSYRLVNSEGDFLPGLIVDRYADGIVVQFLTAGIRQFKDVILSLLKELLSPSFIYERSDTFAIREENIAAMKGLLYGKFPSLIPIRENGFTFFVDVENGQKTGFFFDQRDNRDFIMRFMLSLRKNNLVVADVFSYVGSFSVYLLRLDIKKLYLVDRSNLALGYAEENISANIGNPAFSIEYVKKDAFGFLEDIDEEFDLLILDPPPFARTKKDVDTALKGYRRLNYLGLKKVKSGGFLATFSCSHHISWELFLKEVFLASARTNRKIQIIKRFSHPIDHPVNIAHKEGDYLRGLLLRVV